MKTIQTIINTITKQLENIDLIEYRHDLVLERKALEIIKNHSDETEIVKFETQKSNNGFLLVVAEMYINDEYIRYYKIAVSLCHTLLCDSNVSSSTCNTTFKDLHKSLRQSEYTLNKIIHTMSVED